MVKMKVLSLHKKEIATFSISFLFGIWMAILSNINIRIPLIGLGLSTLTVSCAIRFIWDEKSSYNPLNWARWENKVGELIFGGLCAGVGLVTFICICILS